MTVLQERKNFLEDKTGRRKEKHINVKHHKEWEILQTGLIRHNNIIYWNI